MATRRLARSLLSQLGQQASAASTTACAAAPLQLLPSRAIAAFAFEPPRSIWAPAPGHSAAAAWPIRSVTAAASQQAKSAGPSFTSTPAPPDVQVGHVLDANIKALHGTYMWVEAGPARTMCFIPKSRVSKLKFEKPLLEHFQEGESVKVLVTGRAHDGRLYVSMRDFEEVPGSIHTDKQAVFARAEVAGEAFRAQGKKRLEDRQRVAASIQQGDGPITASVVAVDGARKVVLKVQGQIFSSKISKDRIPKSMAVIGKELQVWCVAKNEQGIPYFSAFAPGTEPAAAPSTPTLTPTPAAAPA